MKKLIFLKFILLISTFGYTQTINFNLANPQPNLVEVWAGTFASGDIDGDGDKDLFMIGQTPAIRTKLYLNDGTGNFTELSNPFPLSSSGQAILKDLDNDGDLDLYFSGQTNTSTASRFTHIYRNNGAGVFTQVTNAGLPNIQWRGAAIADVDNDGDQDIVMTGEGSGVSGVYLNNGNAVFSPQGNSVFAAVSGAVAFIDIEKDGDQDVIISGGSSIKLYQNNGSGIFTLNTNSTFAALSGTDIDVADTDNDGDLDFLVNGNNQNLLYINNGSGIFTQINTTLQPTSGGQNAMADLDNDGDQDLLIVGTQPGGLPNIYNIVYRNTGNNVFTPVDTLGGEYIADCVIDDFTGDGFKDIIIQGFANQTNVYWNTSILTSVPNPTALNQTITYFPNPTHDFVTFNLNEKMETITLYNLQGQAVLSKKVNSKNFTIDISNLSNGTYVAKLNTIRESKTIKLIKF
jgi:Secretion system C-terminal sorting domain/FG-GAP-like repeat